MRFAKYIREKIIERAGIGNEDDLDSAANEAFPLPEDNETQYGATIDNDDPEPATPAETQTQPCSLPCPQRQRQISNESERDIERAAPSSGDRNAPLLRSALIKSGNQRPRPLVSVGSMKIKRDEAEEQHEFMEIMKMNLLQEQQMRQDDMRRRQEQREEEQRQREEDRKQREEERVAERERREAESKRHEQLMQMMMMFMAKGAGLNLPPK